MDEETLNRLIRLRIAIEKTASNLTAKDDAIPVRQNDLGLTSGERRAWLRSEPDFTKRIVTPLHRKRHQTRRYQSPISQMLKERGGVIQS